MVLKFKPEDILFHKRVQTYIKILQCNYPFPGMYVFRDMKTGKVINRNKDLIEDNCILCTNPAAVEVLFGNKQR